MEKDKEGFFYPAVNEDKCVKCGRCTKVCQSLQRLEYAVEEKTMAYACYNKDDEVRQCSTSGGVFSLIADYIITQKCGVVYGVRFDETFRVIHDRAETLAEVCAFRGSKYVQSRMGDIYQQVEKDLRNGRYVLFTGLPCQIVALLHYLGRTYDNLYCMDMVCFGVGAPGIWDGYLTHFHDRSKLSEVVFKDKVVGWKNWQVKIVEAGEAHYYEKKENIYMNSFLKRINIRPSCYSCKIKGMERRSDITIADCWGIGEQNASLNDNKGLSAFVIHSDKGREVFEAIKGYMNCQSYDAMALMEGNWAMFHSPLIAEEREAFMRVAEKEGIQVALNKFCV